MAAVPTSRLCLREVRAYSPARSRRAAPKTIPPLNLNLSLNLSLTLSLTLTLTPA